MLTEELRRLLVREFTEPNGFTRLAGTLLDRIEAECRGDERPAAVELMHIAQRFRLAARSTSRSSIEAAATRELVAWAKAYAAPQRDAFDAVVTSVIDKLRAIDACEKAGRR